MAICEIILLFSLLFLVQAIRLWAFLAFFIRLQTAEEPIRSRFSMDLTLAVARRAGHCWTAGRVLACMFPGTHVPLNAALVPVVNQAFMCWPMQECASSTCSLVLCFGLWDL